MLNALLLVAMSCKKKQTEKPANLIEINSLQQIETEIASGVAMVYFHASWCSKCAKQREAVEIVVPENEFSTVYFGEVEYDDHQDIVNHFNVQGFPTIVYFKDGAEVARMTGENNTAQQIREQLRALL
jgi:thioredoxin 1